MRAVLAITVGCFLIIGCAQAHELTGTWAFIDGDQSYDESQFIRIDEEGNAQLVYGAFEAEGAIESRDRGWVFHSDIGDYRLSILRSLDSFESGAIGVSLVNEYGDILIGYFKKMEE